MADMQLAQPQDLTADLTRDNLAPEPVFSGLVTPIPRRAGRPKDTAKRAAIIQAAHVLFANQPYDVVTMEAVADLAGVSKMTVYSHLQDKETLFETVVASVSDQMIAAITAPAPGGARERLTGVGIAFLQVVLGSDVCRMAHTLPGTLRANPGLASRFYAAGPGRVRAALAEIIAREAQDGMLTVDDPMLAADDLVCLWEGGMPERIAYGLSGICGPAEIARRAIRGTAVFLRAYAASPGLAPTGS